MTETEVLDIASHKIFFVRRYLASHKKLRELCRRLAAERKLVLLSEEGDTYQYVAASALKKETANGCT